MADEERIKEWAEWLKVKSVFVDLEWLEACVRWILSRESINSEMELKNAIYEQWLMSDLMESGSSTLPQSVASIPKMLTKSTIVLQVNSIVNIAESAYSQLKKLKNEDNDLDDNVNKNKTQVSPSSRMLKLDLTDGHQFIEGMEVSPIKKLSSDTLPGTKILIKPNTLCRSGMLFLTGNNIEILGGHVPWFLEEKSRMNMLNKLVMKTKNSTTNDDELSGEQHESNFQVETSNNSSGDNFEVDKWLDDNEDENLLVNLEDDFENQSVPTVVILDDDIPHDVVIEKEFEIDDDIPNDVLNDLDGYEC
ncbi:recQ-mediated genome instability protein 1-like [Xenia sp. Carnegie-2017]|uniref:recQ-mediated genome instability protein 1-like n=1 Tax=Xenia sp. Carnegie-2017 TaxID=2897299 RepID=UPI001F04F22F|nr:recQ-mediated genome instability protein 1-like [Xenia sp. Carnegie-2017]XP_046847264.1 recQ-mediated genome instability protein 1-like [Xenia sp. Carnegie-2017]